jgi:hypothetical protein
MVTILTPKLHSFERDEFIRERFHYAPGEHVTFLAPTQTGKTTLKFQLMKETISKQLKGVVLIMKPRDKVPDAWRKPLKLQLTRDWPPPFLKRKGSDPPGWMVWPKHTFKPAEDDAHLQDVFERAIHSAYKKGNRVLDVDEILGVTDELKMSRELQTLWSRGSSMGCGLWGGSQRPAKIPLLAYSSANHLFIGNTAEKRDRDRYREISGIGIDSEYLDDLVQKLGPHEWIYICRNGPVMCHIKAAPKG